MKRARSQRSLLQTLVLSTALCAPTFFASPTFAQSVAPPKFAKIEYDPNYLPTDSKQNGIEATPLDEIRANFAEPGKNFATGPLWTWNDLLTEEQVRQTMRDLASQDVEQVFVHPRPGLATPYLSDDWFALWGAALDEAKKLDMNVWIYDENSYPSGFAGGFVPDQMPESRGVGLDTQALDSLVDKNGKWTAGDNVIYVLEELSDGSARDRTAEILDAKNAGKPIPARAADAERWVVARQRLAGASQWYGGKTYVDLMRPGVVDAFIGVTHEAYRKRFGDEFGKRVPGVFTDEPQITPAGGLSWTPDLPEEFKKRRGYDLVSRLNSLERPVGDWKKVRYDYYRTALEVFIDRWHKPLAAYCEKYDLEYAGHDWEHGWPGASHCPDNMATAFWRQRPTIDLLMNTYSRGTNAQFGNVRSGRELISAARQAGRSRTLSENYGAGGYDLRFEDMKRLGDWSYAVGVNMTDEHLSYVSIRGARKHDHPQTFSYHSDWFEQYGRMATYWKRLSYLLSRGDLTSERFLLLEPTTTAWFYQRDAGAENGKLGKIGNDFANLLNRLEASQVDYDLGSEDIIQRVGKVDGKTFCVGFAGYETVVLPPNLENLNAETLELLATFVKNGGRLISLGAPIERVDGSLVADLPQDLRDKFATVAAKTVKLDYDALVAEARAAAPLAVIPKTNADNIFHLTRKTDDALILFLCNIDMNAAATGTLEFSDAWADAGLELFDPQTGERQAFSGPDFAIPPCGSLALVASKKIDKAPQVQKAEAFVVDPWKFADRVDVKALGDNVLSLDYLTLKTQGKTIENEYFYRANAWLWRQNGFSKSPWDNGVQFRDELIKREFPEGTGFEAIYRFEKSDAQIANLRLVIETPEIYDVYVNDQKVERIEGAWKFDRAFGVYDVASSAKTGTNEIRLVSAKMTPFSEISTAWLVGAFSLEPRDVGFAIVADKGLSFKDVEAKETIPRASNALEGVSWLSSGVDFHGSGDDRAPSISFAFPKNVEIDGVRIWNYCERNLETRGVKAFTIDGVGGFELKRGDGTAQTLEFSKTLQVAAGQPVRFNIRSNWNGLSYPLPADFKGTTERSVDNGFVGLAEVQFLTRAADGTLQPVDAQPVATASSELAFRSHDRKAQYAVDGSGLGDVAYGWASQGRPFYSGAVDYTFRVKKSELLTDRPILFALPGLRRAWNGAVAAVLVDGKQVGALALPEETVDLTARIAALPVDAEIALTARVYGTPKNLFGPWHAGALRGSAWPGSFHSAPQTPPPGSAYDFIEYGLFKLD